MRYLGIAFLVSLALTTGLAPPPQAITCATGKITWLSGSGPARTPFLITWRGRAVGGGSVNAAGHWAIPLSVGQERPGLYLVEVRSRNDRALIGAFQCTVGVVLAPSAAPAPAQPQPTSTPALATQDFDRNGDGTVTCADFDTQAEAQRALNAGYTDLDGNDKDGLACESLP